MADFDGIKRLYGEKSAAILAKAHVLVIGNGGVGSWAIESLARSGVGHLSLLDYDTIARSNTNRQIHTLSSTLERKKNSVMAERIVQINAECKVTIIDDFLTTENLAEYLDGDFDFVIDAIDSIKFKAALAHHCKREKIPLVVSGGAGGKTDPGRIRQADLSRTENDALLSKVRSVLRKDYGFPRNPKRKFSITAIFSDEQARYPLSDGGVSYAKPGIHGVSLDCNMGYGAISFVTGAMGFHAASIVINTLMKQVTPPGSTR